jgi:hypothetical protein
MRLICVSRYRSGYGSYEPGQDVDVTEEVAGLLLRDSPGSFKIPTPDKPVEEPLTEAAMSTETQTGLTAPDRRARGGRKRKIASGRG